VGIDFVYGIDLFPGRPAVVSLDLSAGNLGAAFVAGARLSLGWLVDRMELRFGYEHLQVGDVELGGFTLGSRIWF
jgi:hypothetical protein